MTSTLPLPVLGATDAETFAARARRRRAARVRAAHLDVLHASVWLSVAAAAAFFLASGAMQWMTAADGVNAAGRLAGLVAAVLMLVQVLLASRAPFVERVIGHDRAVSVHGELGQPIVVTLVLHALLLTVGWALMQDVSVWSQALDFATGADWIAVSVVALGAAMIVGWSSAVAVRRMMRHETWHAIHLLAYVAIAFAAPHQFLDGSTFRGHDPAAYFWAALYVVAFGSLLTWRVGMPLYRALRHRLRVADVERADDGTVTVTMTGHALDQWYARPGQFFLWRFWTPDLWLTAHPYSLSAAPDGRSLRITVKGLGDDSSALRALRPGTRVTAAGPYGVFTHESRTAEHLVLIAAGVGVTPVRAMLEDPESAVGGCDVVIRARTAREAPLLAEIEALAARRGARVHLATGPRGRGWAGAEGPQSLSQILLDPAATDVFVCGPQRWADAVEADARRSGVSQGSIHREVFSW